MSKIVSVLLIGVALLGTLCCTSDAQGQTCNLKVVTDGWPDYSDMQSLIYSITSRWDKTKDKCWALWYWGHFTRRQTAPMNVHGLDCGDPIRQFNDYGYMICSTISGCNCGIWYNMGLKSKYWDLPGHTVSEVEYDGAYHLYDDSMSALFTLCDGKTIAGVEDLRKEGACDASGGKKEPNHDAKYHCLTGTSPMGWLTGTDDVRALAGYGGLFNNRAAYRNYFFDWDWGHRYILNIRPNESYVRTYKRLDGYVDEPSNDKYKSDPHYFIPNPSVGGKDPEMGGLRFKIRGNGVWTYNPAMTAAGLKDAYSSQKVVVSPTGLIPAVAGKETFVIYSVESANVATGQTIEATFTRKTADDTASIAVSTSNGMHWKEVWKADGTGAVPAKIDLLAEVNGSYEILVKVTMQAKAAPADVCLQKLSIKTITQINSKAQPQLTLGKNTIYVGAGDQTQSIVIWPDLQGENYKELVFDSVNIKTKAKHEGWNAVLEPKDPSKEASLTYKFQAPGDIVKMVFGGRFYNQDAGGSAQLLYSTDEGKTWTKVWEAKNPDGKPPFDLMHYETVAIKNAKMVLVKYVLNRWGLYALRGEANYKPASTGFTPLEVTWTWSERTGDAWGKGLVQRSHTQLIEKLPFTYTINVGGNDLPETQSLAINAKGATPAVKYGYSDGKDAGGEKYVGSQVTWGKNLATGKTYECSVPPTGAYDSAKPDNKVLTDGIVPPPFIFMWKPCHTWDAAKPVITVDLGKEETFAAAGMNIATMGDMRFIGTGATVEVLGSSDGKEFTSLGSLNLIWRQKNVPVDYMMPDDGSVGYWNYMLVPAKPAKARYVRFKVGGNAFFCCSELFVLDSYKTQPLDLKIALPKAK